MEYDTKEIAGKIIENVDAVYFTDANDNSYKMIKDNELFRSLFGTSGTYADMMNTLMDTTLDKHIADSNLYSKYFARSGNIKGLFCNKAKMRIGEDKEKELVLNIINLPVDNKKSILILSETDEDDYILNMHSSDKVDAIKSAYLFSMSIDLIADTCQNMAMSEVEGYPANALDISYSQWREMIINMIHPDDKDAFSQLTDPEFLRSNIHCGRSKSIDCQMINLEGAFIWVKLIFSRINTGNDDEYRYVFMVEDIHESHRRLMADMKKYENMAMRDSLTGLYNHGYIETELEACLEKCRAENRPVSLIMFDIDHFKKVNDTFGHATGDNVLKTVSSTVKSLLRTSGGTLGRWGGEEFLGICEGISEDKMYEIAENIRVKISEHEFETVGHLTSSFGVIEVKDDETAKEAFERIDNALYKSKSGGRNRVTRG